MDTTKIQKSFLLKSYSMNFGTRGQRTLSDANYVAYVNSLRDMNGLIKSLKDTLNGQAIVEELWLHKKEVEISGGTVRAGSLEAFDKKPNIAKSCTHVVLVMSEDEKVLEYSKFLINRYMNMLTSVVPASELPNIRPVREKRGGHIPKKVQSKVGEKSEPTVEKVEAPTSFMQKVAEKLIEKLSKWAK